MRLRSMSFWSTSAFFFFLPWKISFSITVATGAKVDKPEKKIKNSLIFQLQTLLGVIFARNIKISSLLLACDLSLIDMRSNEGTKWEIQNISVKKNGTFVVKRHTEAEIFLRNFYKMWCEWYLVVFNWSKRSIIFFFGVIPHYNSAFLNNPGN